MSKLVDWNAGRVQQVRDLAAQNYSASQIAKALDCGATRNSIVGVCHRNGIRLNNRTKHGKWADEPKSRVKPSTPKLLVEAPPAQPAPPSPPPAPPSAHASPPPCEEDLDPAPDEDPPEAEVADGGVDQRLPRPSRAVTLFEAGLTNCRWPLWGKGRAPQPDQAFVCGDPVKIGRPYCADHCKVAYTGFSYGATTSEGFRLVDKKVLKQSRGDRVFATGEAV